MCSISPRFISIRFGSLCFFFSLLCIGTAFKCFCVWVHGHPVRSASCFCCIRRMTAHFRLLYSSLLVSLSPSQTRKYMYASPFIKIVLFVSLLLFLSEYGNFKLLFFFSQESSFYDATVRRVLKLSQVCAFNIGLFYIVMAFMW
ncbi:hypothetical protein Tb11.02.2180 [Trypanosoma brucei brucei TREU927]|uniref:Uncharacterized protein n=1 Tax=Trypanosoma brucei brucei (strain 927/4 GUTat10.1) TaxID=185431 RepID=Q385V9_TRYB2|nr:hypothetical protein Tb11.02.2180 [Trypanosoma brucei brucei TREU927]EAN79422.1 hypothetical protein Tb11.02.2180 [Trypanosoma brucei brucei TREU927]